MTITACLKILSMAPDGASIVHAMPSYVRVRKRLCVCGQSTIFRLPLPFLPFLPSPLPHSPLLHSPSHAYQYTTLPTGDAPEHPMFSGVTHRSSSEELVGDFSDWQPD
ncbi:hypothetical protein FRB93_011656 [Tulasnella sp. JGI-2019a]|nr:hypothetical protein FRB93_011656 [Tulasnella sp. JGI-2019a]